MDALPIETGANTSGELDRASAAARRARAVAAGSDFMAESGAAVPEGFGGVQRQSAPADEGGRARRMHQHEREQALRAAAQEFEAVLLDQMLEVMRRSVKPSDLFRRSRGEEVFLRELDGEMARRVADSGGVGIGEMVFERLRPALRAAGGDGQDVRVPRRPGRPRAAGEEERP